MNQTRSKKHFAARTIATLGAMSVVLAPFAFAAGTQTMDATVASTHSFAVTGGNALVLAPTIATDATDSSTVLSFDTNDGLTYKITVTAAVWAFTASAAGAVAGEYPVLRFVSATSSAGTPSAAPGVLISNGNVAGTTVDVATAIKNMVGTATVTLDASITQLVVAGAYATTVTYALVTP